MRNAGRGNGAVESGTKGDERNEMKDRFTKLPLANLPPADPYASYYCEECGEMDYVDAVNGGKMRDFYMDNVAVELVCEVCMRKRQQAK